MADYSDQYPRTARAAGWTDHLEKKKTPFEQVSDLYAESQRSFLSSVAVLLQQKDREIAEANARASAHDVTIRTLNEENSRLNAQVLAASPDRTAAEAIANAVRHHCTPSDEAYRAGGDALIQAVADWIENPPEWVNLRYTD